MNERYFAVAEQLKYRNLPSRHFQITQKSLILRVITF